MPVSETSDAAFFDLVHSLLEADKQDVSAERRETPRTAYDCVQLMAPYDGKTLPVQAGFFKVRCYDISPRGFSFFAFDVPSFDKVVVALGAIPFTFVTAEVINAIPVNDEAGKYRVGCEFISRLDT